MDLDAVLFDLDMTLLETREDIARGGNVVREHFGLEARPLPELISFIGDGVARLLERTMEETYVGHEDEALEVFRTWYAEHCLDRTYAYAGIDELLTALGARCALAVVSNKPERFCHQTLDGVGLLDRFGTVVGGDTAGALKPDPAPVRLACERLGVSPERAAMVGDTWRDVRVGRVTGATTIAVTYGLNDRARLARESPDHIVDTVADLRDLLIGGGA